jgi:CARDB
VKRRNRVATASSIVLTAVMVIGITAPAAGAAAKGRSKTKRPDLVIKNVRFSSTPSHSASSRVSSVVVENDGSAAFGLAFTVKNRGNAAALLSHVKVLLGSQKFKDEVVGRIGSGKSKTVERSYTAHLTGMGIHHLSICADSLNKLKESNESNNCSPKIKFAAVPRVWNVRQFTAGFDGTIKGDGKTQATGMTFNFFGTVNENEGTVFFWQANGGVTDDLSGKDGAGCTHSGHGAVSHSPWGDQIDANHGYLEITSSLDGYLARVWDPNHGFTSTTTCPGSPPASVDSTELVDPLDTALDPNATGLFHPMQSNQSILAGGFTTALLPGNDVYGSWHFKQATPG